jgi:hypothetical protein
MPGNVMVHDGEIGKAVTTCINLCDDLIVVRTKTMCMTYEKDTGRVIVKSIKGNDEFVKFASGPNLASMGESLGQFQKDLLHERGLEP